MSALGETRFLDGGASDWSDGGQTTAEARETNGRWEVTGIEDRGEPQVPTAYPTIETRLTAAVGARQMDAGSEDAARLRAQRVVRFGASVG